MTRIYPPARRRMAYREDADVADALDALAAKRAMSVSDLIRAATRAAIPHATERTHPMSDHETPHMDDDGVCQCNCPVCIGEMWCTCPDCDVIACEMHGIPTA